MSTTNERWNVGRGKIRKGGGDVRWQARLAIWVLPLLAAVGCHDDQKEPPPAPSEESEPQALSTNGPTGASTDEAMTTSPSPTPAPIVVDAGDTSSKQTVWVLMKNKASLTPAMATADWKARGRNVVDALVDTANQSQASLRALLAQRNLRHSWFWVVNALKVEADAATIQQIAQRPDVAKIVQDQRYQIPPRVPATITSQPTAIEWGLNSIRAPEVWKSFSARGDGIVVANVDTGVEYQHPALARQYRGRQNDGSIDHNYNWFDPTGTCGAPNNGPCDNVGHGTHTMGTMLGDDGDPGANQIGVAPHARWIAAKGCTTDDCTPEDLLRAAQWILAPTDLNGQNPRPELRPNIVNNSWGGGNGDTFFQGVVQAWVSAGIFPAFSVGNSGPLCGSANSPGDYSESYAAGAYDESLTIASFSSLGPSVFGGIKPNLSAPGVSVRSSVPGGGYATASGTSMASPHLAGTVALLWSAAPALLGDVATTRRLLDQAAVDTSDLTCGGDASNNNTWGQGRLDAWAAVALAPVGPSGTLQGTVNDADGNPVSGATVLVQGGPSDRSLTVGEDGSYRTSLGVGSYTLTAKAFGYVDDVVRDVVITQDAVTVQDFKLGLAPSFALSGVVRSTDGAALAGVVVTIPGTPLPPATTDAGGRYSFPVVPAGKYQVQAEGSACYATLSSELVLSADATLDFALPQRTDGYGYSCLPAPYGYVEANTVVPISSRSGTAEVSLPFPFTLYGRTYEKATVVQGGYLSFLPGAYVFSNAAIPNPAQPNAAVYPFWDESNLQPDSSVRTELLGTAPGRQFVIEWRNMLLAETGASVSFEVILFENGSLQMQYVSGSDPSQQGRGATIGIEDQTGTVAFQYSNNRASLTPQSAVLYSLPRSGIVQGILTDANDHTALGGATIEARQGSSVIASTESTPSGFYRLFLPAGSYTLVASLKNYDPAQSDVSVALDQQVQADFALKAGALTLSPSSLQLLVPIGQSRSRTFTLKNTGTSAVSFSLAESGGRKLTVTPTRSLARTMGFSANATNTKGLFPGWSTSAGSNIGIDAAGDILKSFVPAGLSVPWGVGFTGNLWLSDPPVNQNTEFTTDGTATGLKWPTPWAGQWGADMTTDRGRGLVCQLGVGADNGIHCWPPATGVEADKIVGDFPWTASSQRGLAYRPDDDSFYVGGWNEGTIYHVKGLGASDKGTVISSCRPADGTISGLAFNSSAGVLWVATNSPTDTLYELNPEDCTVLSTLAHPTPGFNGGGLDMDGEGNLYMVNQNSRTVYLVDSGVPAFSDVPWLRESPSTGVVAPGQSATLTVRVNTTGLTAGVYLATLYVQSTAGKQRLLRIPVSLVVSAYQQGVVAGGSATTDGQQDPWAADRAYTTGFWGYVQKSKTTSTRKTIRGTSEQRLFRTQRIDPYAYRFDKVPNGVYQIDLLFAELMGAKMGKRLYDVIIENTLVLPAHDTVYEVGDLAADKHVVFVEVTDGQMDVRLVPRAGSELPVVNALRVTHRPDR